MVAMVAYPRFAKDDFAESVFPSRHTALEVVLRILVFLVSGIMEGVGCRAEADNGFAGHEVVIDIMHLFRRELTEPSEDDHQVGMFQGLEPGNVGLLIGIDFTALRV